MPTAVRSRAMRGAASSLFLAGLLLAIGGAAAGAFTASWALHNRVEAAQRDAANARQTLKDERALRDAVDGNTETVAWNLAVEQEKNRDLETQLQLALKSVRDCSLGPDVGRVLRDAVPDTKPAPVADRVPQRPEASGVAGAGGAGDQGAGSREPVIEVEGREVSCKAVAEWAVRNVGIAQENAVEHRGVMEQYEIVRRRHEAR